MNWLPRPGKARVTYPGGSTFEGVFNGERIKEGTGKYTWMKAAEEDGEEPQVPPCLRMVIRCEFAKSIATWRQLMSNLGDTFMIRPGFVLGSVFGAVLGTN